MPNGDYRKYVGKERILIPDEQDRLQYLIDYCLKNYYIKQTPEIDFDCGHYNKIKDLENKLDTIQRIADHG